MLQRGKKAVAAVTAVALAAGILVAGTLAWQSMDQAVANEVETYPNMGARLHDDFNGTNKDVYVENYTNAGGDGQPVFARVRLDEYLEYGTGAGLKTGEDGYGDKDVTVLNAQAKPTPSIDDKTTWTTRKPSDTAVDNPFCANAEWTMGGRTVYMPTFNKDNTDLNPDVNGTLDGTNPDDGIQYDDYQTWHLGGSKTANATYAGGATVNETHNAANTLNGSVMTMAEWQAAGSVPGDYWVWDADGWAYWANPIYPGQATGLLLDGVEMKSQVNDQLYYAIYVVGQMISKDDTGEEDGTGFYAPGQEPSADAETLLERIGAVTAAAPVQAIEVAPTIGEADYVFPNNTMTFQASEDEGPLDNANVTWMVSGNICPGTSVSEDGTLTVDPQEPVGSVLTVTAVEKPLPGGDSPAAFGTYTVTVMSADITVLGGMKAIDDMVISPGITDIRLGLGKYHPAGTVTWEVTDSGVSGSSITEDGVLSVGTGTGTITVTAKIDGEIFGSPVSFKVQTEKLSGLASISQVVPGSATRVTVDGVDWYVLANDGAKALVWAADVVKVDGIGQIAFGSNTTWKDSAIRSHLRDNVLPKLPTMESKVVETQLTSWNGTSYIGSTDTIFLLSEADIFGTREGSDSTDAQDYTYVEDGQGQVLAPTYQVRYTTAGSPLRSQVSPGKVAAVANGSTDEADLSEAWTYRPAMWVSVG